MSSKIYISNTLEELAEHFTHQLRKSIASSNKFNLALSGGNTPKFVFEYLAENYKDKIDWNRITFFWGDERCVPINDKENNYKMAYDSLLSKVNIPDKNIFRMNGEDGAGKGVKNYESILRNNLPLVNGIPQFDLIMLGLGEDGHTASIFPDNLSAFNSSEICEAAVHPVTKQNRITITGSVINNAKKIIFLVTGQSKSPVVDMIINKKPGHINLPASHVNPSNGELVWLLDSSVAALLFHQ